MVKDAQRNAFERTMENARKNGTINDRQTNTDISNFIDSENYAVAPLPGFYGARVFKTSYMDRGDAMTLPGIGIFINPYDADDLDLLKHELGHMLQAQQVGYWRWYKIYGPASAKSARQNGENGYVHQTFWTETNANQLSNDFFGGSKWNSRRFPLIKKAPVIPADAPPTLDAIISQIK